MAPQDTNKRARAGKNNASPSNSRYRYAIPLLILGTFIVVIGVSLWAAVSQRKTWQDWLANLKPAFSSGKGIGPKRDTTGSRNEIEEGSFSYMGEGVAELGEYSVKIFDPVSKCTLRTDFELEGRTTCDNQADFDEFKRRFHRFFQEQVMITIRNSELEDLADPKRAMLSRKLIARVNRALDDRFLESVVFKEFHLFESVDNSGFVHWQPTIEATP